MEQYCIRSNAFTPSYQRGLLLFNFLISGFTNSSSLITKLSFFIAFALSINLVSGQKAPEKINDIALSFNKFAKTLPVEKIYLQSDRNCYNIGDTVWFKCYLLQANDFSLTSESGSIYVEVEDQEYKVIKRIVLPVIYGISCGNIFLNEKDFDDGVYTLRAYTNWMRNFDEQYIYSETIQVFNKNRSPWFVNIRPSINEKPNKKNLTAAIQLISTDKSSINLKSAVISLRDSDKILFNQTIPALTSGETNVKCEIPDNINTKNLNLKLEATAQDSSYRKLIIPISFKRPEKIDLQFMPEGGNLVAGLPANIGLKAVSEDGHGLQVDGEILDRYDKIVAVFKSLKDGIGSLRFTPQSDENYTARITNIKDNQEQYHLPYVKQSGTLLHVNNNFSDTCLRLEFFFTGDVKQQDSIFYLVGQSRGTINYCAKISLKKNSSVKISINKDLFPSGITRFSILDLSFRPINERIVFINHEDNLKLSVSTNKRIYKTRDSVGVNIFVTDQVGRPVKGTFSISITDDSQQKTDLGGNDNIIEKMLLSSDLKGNVENPGQYLQPDSLSYHSLDNLLLTQGWVGYDWNSVTKPVKPPIYSHDKEFTVKGQALNLFHKPLKNADIILFSKSPALTKITKTDNEGKFIFKGFPLMDTTVFLIEVLNKDGKSVNAAIQMEDFVPPQFRRPYLQVPYHYIYSDTVQLEHLKKQFEKDNINTGLNGDHFLKEVIIKGSKFIKGSYNLNGSGNADQVLDERDLEKATGLTLREILTQRVKGFGKRLVTNIINTDVYTVGPRRVDFFIDGIDVENYGLPLKTEDIIDNLKTEDIKGIEILSSVRYRVAYDPDAIANEIGCRGCPPPYMYIEITTRSGKGPYWNHPSNSVVFKPLPYSFPKKFYTPKYVIENQNLSKDIRPTIYWNPDVITDEGGKAALSFYTSQGLGSYTIILEGIGLNGGLGFLKKRIDVNN